MKTSGCSIRYVLIGSGLVHDWSRRTFNRLSSMERSAGCVTWDGRVRIVPVSRTVTLLKAILVPVARQEGNYDEMAPAGILATRALKEVRKRA